jgi:hypothetical protein
MATKSVLLVCVLFFAWGYCSIFEVPPTRKQHSELAARLEKIRVDGDALPNVFQLEHCPTFQCGYSRLESRESALYCTIYEDNTSFSRRSASFYITPDHSLELLVSSLSYCDYVRMVECLEKEFIVVHYEAKETKSPSIPPDTSDLIFYPAPGTPV